MKRHCPSANRVSKAREDFPEPDTPVTTVTRSWGIRRETFFRLFWRARWMRSQSECPVGRWTRGLSTIAHCTVSTRDPSPLPPTTLSTYYPPGGVVFFRLTGVRLDATVGNNSHYHHAHHHGRQRHG